MSFVLYNRYEDVAIQDKPFEQYLKEAIKEQSSSYQVINQDYEDTKYDLLLALSISTRRF